MKTSIIFGLNRGADVQTIPTFQNSNPHEVYRIQPEEEAFDRLLRHPVSCSNSLHKPFFYAFDLFSFSLLLATHTAMTEAINNNDEI